MSYVDFHVTLRKKNHACMQAPTQAHTLWPLVEAIGRPEALKLRFLIGGFGVCWDCNGSCDKQSPGIKCHSCPSPRMSNQCPYLLEFQGALQHAGYCGSRTWLWTI